MVRLSLALSEAVLCEPPNIKELLPEPATPAIVLSLARDPSFLDDAASLDRYALYALTSVRLTPCIAGPTTS